MYKCVDIHQSCDEINFITILMSLCWNQKLLFFLQIFALENAPSIVSNSYIESYH